jgi:hypothetical protein
MWSIVNLYASTLEMSSTDRSQTERIRRLRGQIQAVRRAECAACPELGPQGPTDQSTWLNRRFGQAPYLREAANGAIQTLSCCGTGVCDASTINFDDYITFLETNEPGKTYSITFTIDGSDMTVTVIRQFNGETDQTVYKLTIIYIQSDMVLTNLDLQTNVYINNSANTLNLTIQYIENGQFYPFQLSPCGAI